MSAINAFALVIGMASSASTAPPPAPVVSIPAAQVESAREPHLATWEAGEITCTNGRSLPGTLINRPIPTRLSSRRQFSLPAGYRFTLGPEGRALSIRSAYEEQRVSRTADLAPSIASSNFPAFDTTEECTVFFQQSVTPLDEAPLEDLVLLRAFDRSARVPSEAWERFSPGNCDDKPRIRALTRSYPDYRKLPRAPGTRDWVFLSYNTDADGKPVDISIVGSSENAQLNAAGVEALSNSRYTEGKRTGCIRYFWGGTGTIEAPERAPLEKYGKNPEGCDTEGRWAKKPRLNFPRSYRRRGVQGWAVLRFDVAPWGEIGNIKVVEAQPTDELGVLATPILRSASYSEQDTGLKGCITRVVFRLPDRSGEEDEEAED